MSDKDVEKQEETAQEETDQSSGEANGEQQNGENSDGEPEGEEEEPEEGSDEEESEQVQQEEGDVEGEEETTAEGDVIEFPENGSSEEEEDEEEGPHPLEILNEVIEDLESQQKRLGSKNAGNLKFELKNNVYPAILRIAAVLYDYIDYMESDEESEEDQAAAEMEEVIKEETEKIELVCEAIMKVDEEITGSISDENAENWRVIVDWAKEKLPKEDQDEEE